MALADAKVSSEPETLDKSVSTAVTPVDEPTTTVVPVTVVPVTAVPVTALAVTVLALTVSWIKLVLASA